MGLQLSRDIELADDPRDWSTFRLAGTDRIDVRAIGNPVAVELESSLGQWSQTIVIDSGDFESISGLAIAYKPNGVAGFRLYNATKGAVATARIRAYNA